VASCRGTPTEADWVIDISVCSYILHIVRRARPRTAADIEKR
jgi:hypothetical protein